MHCNDLNALPVGYILKSILRCKKIVYDAHELESEQEGQSRLVRTASKFLEGILIKKADVIMTVSNGIAKWYKNQYYQPAPNHFSAQPIKMFEFMAAGLPVIASDFPLWKKIIEDSGCGICVNPTKSDEVRRACLKLVNNRELGKKMGLAGRKYVVEKYNWAVEEKSWLIYINHCNKIAAKCGCGWLADICIRCYNNARYRLYCDLSMPRASTFQRRRKIKIIF